MNNRTISNTTTKEAKTYRASFDRYSAPDQGNVFLNFTKVRDDKGNLIKKRFSIGASAAVKLVGNLLPEQEVLFSANVVTGEDYSDGFDFIAVSFIQLE